MKVQRKYYSKDEREEILKRTDGLCAHCGKKLNADNMTVEHIIPLYKGGKDDKYNIIALCEKCNKDKNNYTVYFDTYYKYINENEERYYLTYSNTKTNKFKDDSLFYFDRAYMEHLPYSIWHIASEMKNRGASKSKIDKIVQKGLKTVIIEKRCLNRSFLKMEIETMKKTGRRKKWKLLIIFRLLIQSVLYTKNGVTVL